MRYIPMMLFVTLCLLFAGMLLTRPDTPTPLPTPLIDKALPEFTLPDIDGNPIQISALAKGKVMIINIFASWCVPCLMEHPHWAKIVAKHNVQIIGIGWKDKPDRINAWLGEHGNPYHQVLIDSGGEVTTLLGITGVPETYIIDAKGVIRHKISAPLNKGIIEDELLPILKQMESE